MKKAPAREVRQGPGKKGAKKRPEQKAGEPGGRT